MVLIIGIAGAAALAVLLYNHLREQQPELATLSTRRAQQLAAVVLVLSKAVDGVIDALALGLRPSSVVLIQHPVAGAAVGRRRLGRPGRRRCPVDGTTYSSSAGGGCGSGRSPGCKLPPRRSSPDRRTTGCSR